MMQKKAHVKQLAVWTAAAIMIFFAAEAVASVDTSTADEQPRADMITIDGMKTFGPLERASVEFLHDKHTETLKKDGKDCLACHIQDKTSGKLSIKFQRTEDKDRQTVMDTYHKGCISCHNELLSEGKSSGPVECAECHNDKTKATSNWQEIGMDHSLHYRHTKALDKKCETCHHEYDQTTKKLVYVKGEEGTCRYCHKEQTEDNRIAMRQAAHIDCVNCHRTRIAQNKSAGPVECAGCHDPKHQAAIEKIADVPRMEMKQPDTVFVKAQPADATDTEAIRMKQVPFDHKAHETYNDTCRACHHASMKGNLTGCTDCHTLKGEKEGDWVSLEEAMHRSKAGESCEGCHKEKQTAKECAGCHGSMVQTATKSPTYCNTCHLVPLVEKTEGETTPAAAETEPVTTETAADALAARVPTLETYPVEDIPETVTIKSLSETYQPVELPHRKIVLTLLKGIQGSKLAQYFHTQPGTLCQGCHHNSPAAVKPPKCESCHGKAFQNDQPYRPGLKAAYHQECMGCHKQMNIEKPASRDCVACHKKK